MEFYLSEVKQEEKEILYWLLQYSLFEESENDLNEMNQEAIYEYKHFDSYFIDNYRYAFFIREKETDKLLGFAMINEYLQKSKEGHSIAVPLKNLMNDQYSRDISEKVRSTLKIK